MADDVDRLAALYLRERLEARLAWHTAGEPLRDLSTPFGRICSLRDSVDLLPRGDDEAWRNIAALSLGPVGLESLASELARIGA